MPLTPLPINHAFDTEFADELARLESYNKNLYRPNTYLHKWWARRCGTTFRAILKQLVEGDRGRDYYVLPQSKYGFARRDRNICADRSFII